MRRIADAYVGMRWQILALVAVCALLTSSLLAFSRPIVMLVDGQRVDTDVAPVTTANARAFVPLRSIADALGAETEVDAKTGAISVILRKSNAHAARRRPARNRQRHAAYAAARALPRARPRANFLGRRRPRAQRSREIQLS